MNDLTELVQILDGAVVEGQLAGVRCTSLQLRSDAVTDGALFCCIPGSRTDGHTFAADAVARGAAALLAEHVPDGIDTASTPVIIVDGVRTAIGPLADAFNGSPTKQLEVLGVTGTNGKTTTSHLLAAMLRAAGRAPGLLGTTGITVGEVAREATFTTPEAPELQALFAEMVAAGNKSCAMEVSSHALDQGRVTGTRFAAVGFTNLTRDHLDYHRGFESYYLAKRRLFADRGPEGQRWPAAINCDDEWGARLFDEIVHSEYVDDVPTWGYTLSDMHRASVSAHYDLTATGAIIVVESPIGEFRLESRLRGRFNVENVLCATTMALIVGLEPEQIQAGLADMESVPGRLQAIDEGQPFDVFVDYAHTPDSLEQVLSSVRTMVKKGQTQHAGDGAGRVIVVFGCGGDRDKTKRPEMGRVAATRADIAIVTSDNPRSEDPAKIVSQIRAGMRRARSDVKIELDRREAIKFAIQNAEPGDAVVIAGKGHELGQAFADRVIAFDDAQVAREELASLPVS